MLPAESLEADGAFSYVCNRCRRCCSGKRIRVNPYEVYRLARGLAMTTTEFIGRHTTEFGTELARMQDGRCVFLGDQGCTVHENRPLVCRLYPLGRRVTAGEPDRFHHLEPHAHSEGNFGNGGTVAGYLDAQGAGPFMHAADVYLEVVASLARTLARLNEQPDESNANVTTTWLDIDAVLATADGPSPANAEEAMDHHRAALLAWSRNLSNPEEGT